MNMSKVMQWICRIYSMLFCTVICVLLVIDIALPYHFLHIRDGIGYHLIFWAFTVVYVVLCVLLNDTIINIVTALSIIALPIFYMYQFLDIYPEWLVWILGGGIFLSFGVKLVWCCWKNHKIIITCYMVASLWVFFAFTVLVITIPDSELPIVDVLEEKVSPGGIYTAKSQKYDFQDLPDRIEVRIYSNQYMDIGIFCFERNSTAAFSSAPTDSIEITWISDYELSINGHRHVQDPETGLWF